MIISLDKSAVKLNIKKIAIDTNILLWAFYGNTTYAHTYQKNTYPNFLADIIQKRKCTIYTTIHNICELYNVVEKNEYDLYIKKNALLPENFARKQYRGIKEEREKIQKVFELLYKQISQCIEISEYNINDNIIKEYNQLYKYHRYDMFDFTLLKFCKENNIDYILTDDSDFASYKEYINTMNIITANKNLK